MRLAPSQREATARLAAAYDECWRIAAAHDENFTLGSWLLPRALRRHVAAIYAFARTADDFADEGAMAPEQRLACLAEWEQQLRACFDGQPRTPIFVALANTATTFRLPIEPFLDLLQAFRRDVEFHGFCTFDELRAYCRQSADPVGRLILHLFGYRDVERQQLADAICTGLQLANFWQDLAIDTARGRQYVPAEDLERFGCTLTDMTRTPVPPAVRRLMQFEVQRARRWLQGGLPLADRVHPRLAREVRLFAWGGLAVLRQIEAADYDVVRHRPTVSARRKALLVIQALALVRRRPAPAAGAPEHRYGAEQRELQEAYAYCQAVTRRSSSNFYYAFRLLPPERRDGLYAVYAFCRFLDDIADDGARRNPQALLDRWRDELDRAYAGAPTHPIGRALADATRRFPLQADHFRDLIRGVEMDVRPRRYRSFDELYEYCYLVASTVGLLCIAIFGHRHDSARAYATDLGIAFQLTNILRDVREDSQRGRIYLPLDDLRRFDCTQAELLSGRYTSNVGALMAFECGRARAYYLRARAALHPEDRAALAAAEAMRLIYERLLDRIEARHFNVFGGRVTLPRYQKLTLAFAAWGRAQLAVLGS